MAAGVAKLEGFDFTADRLFLAEAAENETFRQTVEQRIDRLQSK